MILKTKEKEKAIKLRRRGFSYNEILSRVPVAKSTLSLWLRSVGLSKRQKQRLTEKKLAAMKRGWEVARKKRILRTEKIQREAIKEIGKINKRDLWMIGIAFHWAEGSKERSRAVNLQFGNSDPEMIKVFLRWVERICKISSDNIHFSIYLHKNAASRVNEVKKYWSEITGFPIIKFQKIIWKKHKVKTLRKNVGKNYFGLLRITVRKSADLNRKVFGWIKGVCQKINNAGSSNW